MRHAIQRFFIVSFFLAASMPAQVSPPTIQTQSPLPSGTQGAPYTTSFTASGGSTPYEWTVNPGSILPSGLTLSTAGVLSGTPLASGSFSFTIRCKSAGTPSAPASTKFFQLAIAPPPLQITTSSLPNGTVGSAYPAPKLDATGGQPPYTWGLAVGSGPLPGGLQISGAAITGTPNAAGTFTFTLRVTDGAGASATRALSITIVGPLTITTNSLPNATLNVSYNATLAATGGSGAGYVWGLAAGSANPPPGLIVNRTGTITGTPTQQGTFQFIVQVFDSQENSATRTLSITVGQLTITTDSLPQGTTQNPYNQQLQA
ncbi:MAG: putative Ig domain-containing protein, partial [Bryobacteraceae bacterium]